MRKSLAEEVLSGRLDFDHLPADDEEAIAHLTAVKGIGRWTAEIYLLFAEGRPDVFPAGDLAVQIEIGNIMGLDGKPDRKGDPRARRSLAPPPRRRGGLRLAPSAAERYIGEGMSIMPAAWGIGLAVAAAVLARLVGFDRDRAFYPLVLIVVAAYYALFAVIGGSGSDLIAETLAFALFAAAAIFGFRTSLWIVVAGLALHGVFDFFHHALIANRGVPSWWPTFCLSYDVAAAACLAVILLRHGGSRGLAGTTFDSGIIGYSDRPSEQERGTLRQLMVAPRAPGRYVDEPIEAPGRGGIA